MGATLVLLLVIYFVSAVNAQELKCSGADVRSIQVAPELIRTTTLDDKPDIIEAGSAGAAGDELIVVVIGPISGPMDSFKIDTRLLCDAAAVRLTATIVRSEHFNGSVARNQIWRPTIKLVVVPHRAEVKFQAIWNRRLTNGAELEHAATPPYAERKFPIVLTKTLRAIKKPAFR